MKSLFSSITSTLTELRPQLLVAGAVAATAGTYYLISRHRDRQQRNITTEESAHTQLEAPRWEKLYCKGRLLGKGGFGSVYAGKRRADRMPVAIKFIPKKRTMKVIETSQGVLPLEVALMQRVNSTPCTNVLQLLDWFDEPSCYILILERPRPCQDVDAFCKDHGMNESLSKTVMAQLIRALIHCKTSGVFHRDVKAQNLLIQTDTHEVKLIDFGCGDILHNSAYEQFSGTKAYAPPEWFQQRQYWAEPATVWSVGVTLYKMMCCFVPFSSFKETTDDCVDFPEDLSAECCDLIRLCLKPNPADRPTLEQIQLHPWFH